MVHARYTYAMLDKLGALLTLIAAILLTEAVGSIGSIFSAAAIPTWYEGLTKPFFTPPGWVFGPVWALLYLFMGIAAYVMWRKRHRADVRRAIALFVVQLVLNALWTPVFFGLQYPLLGVVVITMLLAAIAFTTYYFWRVEKWAGVLMLPYVFWVAFATALNIAIWWLN